MPYKSIKGFSGWAQMGILLVFLALGFMLVMIVQYVIIMQLMPSGIPLEKSGQAMVEAMLKPENINYARLMQVLGTFCMLFVPAMLYLWVCHGRNMFWLGFNHHLNFRQILLGFLLLFFTNLIAAPLADLSKIILSYFPDWNALAQNMENAYTEQITALSNLKSWGEFIMAIFIMAFFPALFEEVFFRGSVQNLLVRWWKKPLFAILITSLLFSLIHSSLYLFLSRALLGFVLGLMYYYSKNIWINITGHFLNNVMAVTQLFWISRHNGKIEPDKLSPQFPVWGVVIAMTTCCILFFIFKKVSQKNNQLIEFEEQNLLYKNELN